MTKQEYAKCEHCKAMLVVENKDFMAYSGNFLVAMDKAKLCCDDPCIDWVYQPKIIFVGMRKMTVELYAKDVQDE